MSPAKSPDTVNDEPNPFPDEPESDFNLAEYLIVVRRHWKLVTAACLTTVAAAAVHYSVTPKLYMSTALIQIERRSLAPVLSNQAPWLDSYFDMEYYPTQYKLLESRGLAERVVKSLDLVEDPSWNPGRAAARDAKRGPSAEDDQATLGILAAQVQGGLTVEPVRSTQLVALSYRSGNPEFAAKAANAFAESFIDMGIENRYASAGKASTFLTTQIETLKREIDEKETKLQAFSRKKGIVTLEPGSNVTLQRLEALNGNFIGAKKIRIEKEAAYKELLTAPKETIADTLAPGVVGDMRTEQRKRESEYEAKLKTFKPDWPEMIARKAEIEKGREHLKAAIDEVVETAKKSAYAAFLTALRQEQSLETEMGSLKSAAMDQNQEAVEYNNLGVEIKTRRDLLNELMRKQSENDVQARLQDTRDSNVHIVDHALVPGGPFQPSLRKDLSYGLLLGLLLGVGCSLLIEFMDRTMKSPEEVERRLALPTLAVIQDIYEAGRLYGYERYGEGYGYGYGEGAAARVRPAKGKRSAPADWLEKKKAPAANVPTQIELVPHDRPRTPISEAYRSLRTALLLSSARELRLVALTSAVAGEGKTATAANLAVVLAQLGRPVLIVDCDLRKPRLHQVFKASNQVGLVSHLTATAELEDIFLPTTVPNLWVTPSGPIPPNPSELLSSERMREFLRTVRERFDYVIVDTPPALAVTDATLVGVLADGVILTLRSGKVTREEARLCRDRLLSADIKILGAVLNRYQSTQAGMYKRYRSYEVYAAAPESTPKAGSAA
ncbi:MAG: polysaccharide biosynthesis transport protein [Acidobacteriota bacterium]|jgi:capsular exopolysaccharide synthesis family protein|nr:polysaccharide biosynthesis transport protein [Acidobacteriota bacterium]